MKLCLTTTICILSCAIFPAGAMDAPPIVCEQTAAYSLIQAVSSHERDCQTLCGVASNLAGEIDVVVHQALPHVIIRERNELITRIERTLLALAKDPLDAKFADELALKCYKLIRELKGCDFVMIESKMASLPMPKEKSGREDSGPNPYVGMPAVGEDVLRRQQNGDTAIELPLPESISSKAVYHVKTYQLNEVCCGYNALFNACNIEDWCGLANIYSNYEIFRDACMGYLGHRKINPKAGVDCDTLNLLAEGHLKTRNICNLDIIENKVTPTFLVFSQAVVSNVPSPSCTNLDIIVISAIEAEIMRQKQVFFEEIDKHLMNGEGPYDLIHFICIVEVRGVWHAVLLTVVQNNTGRGLYIFDNCNERIEEDSASKRYIDFLCEALHISQKDQFKGPRMPDGWPTVHRQEECSQEKAEPVSPRKKDFHGEAESLEQTIAKAERLEAEMIETARKAIEERDAMLARAVEAERLAKEAREAAIAASTVADMRATLAAQAKEAVIELKEAVEAARKAKSDQ